MNGRGARVGGVSVSPAMSDVLIALGLVFAIEGLVFAAFPAAVKRAMVHVMETPDEALRIVGLVSAILGIGLIWLFRG